MKRKRKHSVMMYRGRKARIIGERLWELMIRTDTKASEVAKRMGVSESRVRQTINGNIDFSDTVVNRFIVACGGKGRIRRKI